MVAIQGVIQRFQRYPLLLPHTLMMFLCITNFDILRNLKESLLVTRLGAEIIPFVKFWVVMPTALIFLLSYGFLANRLNRHTLFIVTLVPFLFWLPLFSTVIYPNLDTLTLNALASTLEALLPENLIFVAGLIQYWPLTLFFALAELWGTGVICLLFWTQVNDSYCKTTAQDVYPQLLLIGNMASLFSGPMLVHCVNQYAGSGDTGWQNSLILISILFGVNGLLILGIHEYCHRFASPAIAVNSGKTTTSLPFLQSVRFLAQSSYLGYIALIMLSYCIAMNMIEVAWKSQLVAYFPKESDYAIIMGYMTFMLGIGCILCSLLNKKLLAYSWYNAAISVPIIMLTTATPFFLFTLLGEFDSSYFNLLLTAVLIGGISNVLSKSAKYTLFDASKELAFVPLDNEQKYKGKAAIELLVSRLGKSGSAFFQQFLVLMIGSLTGAIPWLAGVFFLAVALWFMAVKQLNKHYMQITG